MVIKIGDNSIMAGICKCCGKKIGILGGSRLSEIYNEPICEDCRAKFGVKLNLFKNSKNIYELNVREEDLLKIIDKCNFSCDGKDYLLFYVNTVKVEIENNIIEDEKLQNEESKLRNDDVIRKLQFRESVKNHVLTTGYNFENFQITAYLGVISGSVVLGTGFLSEFGASISDLFGTQSDLFSDKLEEARELSLIKLKEKSVQLGGNALIGIDFDYITFSNNMIGVVANGTSVVVEKIE